MKKKILLTRPYAASARFASLLAREGFEVVIEPLLVIHPTQTPRPSGVFQAVMITSAQAPEALEDRRAELADLFALPCFCVGVTTGDAARRLGFTDIRCGTSDSAALARNIAEVLPDKTRPVLHLAGDVVEDRGRDRLAIAGMTLVPWVVYQARAVEDFTTPTRAAFAQGVFAALPVFSPRSARILVSILEKNKLTEACRSILAVGLSQAVADVLQVLPWRRLGVAATPSEAEILACLQTEIGMTETDTPPPSLAAPSKVGAKKTRFVWGVLLGVVLAGGLALSAYPFTQSFVSVFSSTPPDDTALRALAQRVEVLESRPAALVPDVALTETIKSLQAQITQIQNQGAQDQHAARKAMTQAFAFWDLRENARQGRVFAQPLEALRATIMEDAALLPRLDKLAPYATAPPPSLPQLGDDLIRQESSLPAEAGGGVEPNSLRLRIETALRHLISVRPLHDPRFSPLEAALQAQDAAQAQTAFQALPEAFQKNLGAWQEKFKARLALEKTLQDVAAALTEPSP